MNPAALLGDEGLDEDFFAPPPGGTLANIFGTKHNNSLTEENSSLKYVPPKPLNLHKPKEPSPENVDQTQTGSASKTSECLLAKAAFAHELVSGSYEPRGKLGFAIIKMLNTSHYKVVLYNSEKKTLSSATATSTFQVTIQSNNYITYYDDNAKNWSLLFSNSEDLSNVRSVFMKCGIHINKLDNETAVAPELTTEFEQSNADNNDGNESTDEVKLDRQAKISLLNRISLMGVPMIYPKPPLSTDRTSDSSDTNEEGGRQKDKLLPARHKGFKTSSIVRKYGNKHLESSEGSVQDVEREKLVTNVVPLAQQTHFESSPLFTYINGQLVPVPSNDAQISNLNVYLSETRASNSEVRININRLTDKVDRVLDKIKLVDDVRPTETIDRTSSFTTEIFQKLLHEYEDKIRLKDARIKTLEENFNKNCNQNVILDGSVKNEEFEQKYEELLRTKDKIMSENTSLKNELDELRKLLDCKNNELEISKEEIKRTKNEIDNLQKNINIIDSDKVELAKKLVSLETQLHESENRNRELNVLHERACGDLEKLASEHSNSLLGLDLQKKKQDDSINPDVMESKIKRIMNNTFRGLAANFEIEQSYSGDEIRIKVASIIKQMTLEALTPQKHP